MSGKSDVAKGKIKEAVGVVTDNEELREEGQTDQAVGRTKENLQKAVKKIQKVAEKTIDQVKGR